MVGILGGIIVLGIILCVVVFSILNNQKNADYYVLGTDQIPSVKTVVGTRDLSGVSTSTQNGVSAKTYDYKSETSTDDVSQYITYLVDEEGFIPTTLNQQSDQPVYAKKSVEEGKILVLMMVDTGFGYIALSVFVSPFLFCIEQISKTTWFFPLGVPCSIASVAYLWSVFVLLKKMKNKLYATGFLLIIAIPFTMIINFIVSMITREPYFDVWDAMSIGIVIIAAIVLFSVGHFRTKKTD